MAIGTLGYARGDGSAGTKVAYTCPAGISHAVVHVTISSTSVVSALAGRQWSAQLLPSGVASGFDYPIATIFGHTSGSPSEPFYSKSVSIMMSPGDRITCLAAVGQWVTVTGYEVP